MSNSIIKDKESLAIALEDLLNHFHESGSVVIIKEYFSDNAIISFFYCKSIEEMLDFLALKVAGSYPIAFSVVSAVCCYYFKHSEIPLFELSPRELMERGFSSKAEFGTIRQIDLCDHAFRIFIQSKVVIIRLAYDKKFDFRPYLSDFFEKMKEYIQKQPLYTTYWLIMFVKRKSDAEFEGTERGLCINENYKNAKCLYSIVLVEVNKEMVENAVGNEAVINSIDGSIKRAMLSVAVDDASEEKVREMEMESVEELLIRMYGEVPNFAPLDKLREDYFKLQEEKQKAEEEKQKAEEEKRKAEEEKQKAEEEKRKAEEEKQKSENLIQKFRSFLIEKGFDPDKI